MDFSEGVTICTLIEPVIISRWSCFSEALVVGGFHAFSRRLAPVGGKLAVVNMNSLRLLAMHVLYSFVHINVL
jgi:hypothetical protein